MFGSILANIEHNEFYLVTNSTDKFGSEKLTMIHYQGRFELLQSYWDKFTKQHDIIIAHPDDAECSKYIKDLVFGTAEADYSDAKAILRETIYTLSNTAAAGSAATAGSEQGLDSTLNTTNDVNMRGSLSKLQLPVLSGKQETGSHLKIASMHS